MILKPQPKNYLMNCVRIQNLLELKLRLAALLALPLCKPFVHLPTSLDWTAVIYY